jgi:hypothetical protein
MMMDDRWLVDYFYQLSSTFVIVLRNKKKKKCIFTQIAFSYIICYVKCVKRCFQSRSKRSFFQSLLQKKMNTKFFWKHGNFSSFLWFTYKYCFFSQFLHQYICYDLMITQVKNFSSIICINIFSFRLNIMVLISSIISYRVWYVLTTINNEQYTSWWHSKQDRNNLIIIVDYVSLHFRCLFCKEKNYLFSTLLSSLVTSSLHDQQHK